VKRPRYRAASRLNPSTLHPSLPTPWCTKKRPSESGVVEARLPFLVGFELVLQALVLEIRATPR
jgi:hypothetical protein